MLKSDWRTNLLRNESFERVHQLDTAGSVKDVGYLTYNYGIF